MVERGGDFKKAGTDLVNLPITLFEAGGDLGIGAENDVLALFGDHGRIAYNNQFLNQEWRPNIASFKKKIDTGLFQAPTLQQEWANTPLAGVFH